MENEKGIVRLTRQQIYDDIWKMSVAGVSRKYDLHYARLIEKCKKAEIPFPSSGYWTRKNFGKDVSAEVVPLSGDGSILVDLPTNAFVEKRIKNVKIVPEMSGILEFLAEDERQKVLRIAYYLEIDKDAKLHKVLVQYKKQIAEYEAKLKDTPNQRYYNSHYNKHDNKPDFFKEVSENGIKRFMRILDAVFKAVEKLGGSVNDDLSIKIRNDVVQIRVAEAKDKVKHEITKQEAQALLKYEDAIKRKSWAPKPKIRQYDHIYNGRIRIVFGEKSYIRDSEKEKLEDRLGDILIALYEKSEENRIIRVRREEARRKREEEERIQEEIRNRKEEEIRLTRELTNKAEDFRIASEIRAYINAVFECSNKEVDPEWIEWASRKADWYDPTKDIEDEYLGKRDHGKNSDEKDLSKISVKRGWYW